MDNSDSPKEESTSEISDSSKKRFFSKKALLVIGGIAFSLCIVAGLVIFLLMNRINMLHTGSSGIVVKSPKAVNYFSVVSVYPQNNSRDNAEDTPITITFSEPVKPNSLRSFFTESPMIPGTFSQGKTPNEVVFKAKYTYGTGTSVRVILNKGFESIAGHKFTSDFTYNFFTKVSDNSVVFGNNDINSRWVNLPVGKKTTFNLQVGNNISSDANVTIYKGTFDRIVSSLLYSNQTHTDSNYVTQTYINYPVDTTKMEQVSVIKNIQNGSNFEFNQGEGLYYIEAKNKDQVVGSTWVSVNDQGLIVQQDDQKLIIATQNIKTGDINSKVKVYLYNLEEKPTLVKILTVQGYAEVPVVYPQKVDLVVGETDTGVILAPLTVPETQADIRVNNNLSQLDKIYLQTDRPTYKIQDTVKFRGIIRYDNDAQYTLPTTGDMVRLWIPDPTDGRQTILDQKVTISDGGIFSGEFAIPPALTPAADKTSLSLTLYAKEENENTSSLSMTSRSYTTFDVVSQNSKSLITVRFDKNTYTRDEHVIAHIKATDASGNPLPNKKITYAIYTKAYYENDPASVANFGTDWGEPTKVVNKAVTLDSNGKADVPIDQLSGTTSQAITLKASMQDTNGSPTYGAKTVLVQQGKIILTFGPSRQNYHSGDTTLTRVYAKDINGNPVGDLDIAYDIYTSEYDTPSQSYKETIVNTGTVKTDSNGFVLIQQPVTTDISNVTIRVKAKDSANNTIQEERSMTVSSANAQQFALYYHNSSLTNFDVATDKLSYHVGDTAHLIITSPFDQNVLVSYESGRIYHTEWLKLTKGENKYDVIITSELFPSFSIIFSYFNNASLYTEGLQLNVSNPSKNLIVTTDFDKQAYVINDSVQLSITTKDSTGQAVSAHVAVNIVDDSIFNLRNTLPSGDVYWNFYYPRLDTTNFSASTLGIGTGSGCGGGSGIDISYVPNRLGSTYYWNPNVTTDQNGEAHITLPLSNSGNFRVFVTASDNTTAVGQSQSSLLVE